MDLIKHQHSTLNGRVCFTFIQNARDSIKLFLVVVLVVRMLPKKLLMKLHKKNDKESSSSLFGVHFLSTYFVNKSA